MSKLIKINAIDNVAVAKECIAKGEVVQLENVLITAISEIPQAHKMALCNVNKGEDIIKYGFPIGKATKDIKPGDHVHTHNVKTNLSETLTYEFKRGILPSESKKYNIPKTFMGYMRKNGKVGIRNEIWIIPTVGCVNKTVEKIAKQANKRFAGMCDGFLAYTHPYGCSQMGDDQVFTQKILSALAMHPNTSGVLVVGLGCENNNIKEFKKFINEENTSIKYMVTQDCDDEIEEALALLEPLAKLASTEKRAEVPLDKLVVALKCGGSDAFSGITANALCGKVTDVLSDLGGSIILTEVPEMFGAEQILMERSKDKAVFEKIVHMINDFKTYYINHNQVVYENPSPGNKAGGITTLEEKSLGCVQKGGCAVVNDVLAYADSCTTPGLNLLTGPGNDMVSCTNLTASGAHIILFTTGRGTPLGAPIPTVKISSNTDIFTKKQNWFDFNAGTILEDGDFQKATEELLLLICNIANGQKTKNEINEYREIAIFKDGVTL